MTKEEALKILQNIYFEVPEIKEALQIAIEALSQSSLPSNLDEAAEEAYPKMSRLSEPHGVIPADNKTHYLGDANEENRVAFKAGAKWMAEQGESHETEIVSRVTGNGLLPAVTCLVNKSYKEGDKVKVIVIPEED